MGGNFSQIASTGENITSYSDNSVSANNTYIYRVVAYNTAGNSQFYSNEATAITVSVPIFRSIQNIVV